ncbi:RES domain-containing protein [Chitinimonas arctica]|uniref:RES domain-containing protein n=1 Tax=Chitinimonas arctica TaxID=2594795 RepID=A0A516SEF8_9NEIS|nr:RES family NAD+ phosphorylase [Chitinimonas arctica]QDQ26542.1 RES domain-containing protein [Chitinimonas arctica]
MPIAAVVNARHRQLQSWRSVESQQQGATLALVGNDLRKQQLLEELLDLAKPPLPEGFAEAEKLHYLLFSPFRYCASRYGTRFGRPFSAGIFYGADAKETAMAETGYWNSRFAHASEGLRSKSQALRRTLFKVVLKGAALDLRKPPYDADPQRWMSAGDYADTWAIGDAVRAEGAIDLVQYSSVRAPLHGGCVAVFNPRAFAEPNPIETEEWDLYTEGSIAVFIRGSQREVFDFN